MLFQCKELEKLNDASEKRLNLILEDDNTNKGTFSFSLSQRDFQ